MTLGLGSVFLGNSSGDAVWYGVSSFSCKVESSGGSNR